MKMFIPAPNLFTCTKANETQGVRASAWTERELNRLSRWASLESFDLFLDSALWLALSFSLEGVRYLCRFSLVLLVWMPQHPAGPSGSCSSLWRIEQRDRCCFTEILSRAQKPPEKEQSRDQRADRMFSIVSLPWLLAEFQWKTHPCTASLTSFQLITSHACCSNIDWLSEGETILREKPFCSYEGNTA